MSLARCHCVTPLWVSLFVPDSESDVNAFRVGCDLLIYVLTLTE